MQLDPHRVPTINSEVMANTLITNPATRARQSTSTEKMAALLVSASFVNIA